MVATIFKETLGGCSRPSLQLALSPHYMDGGARAALEAQHDPIRAFFQNSIEVATAHLHDIGSPIARLLFSELPSHVGVDFHRALPQELWTQPQFFRTDQSVSGKIYEFQAPGSGWGDFELIGRAFQRLGIPAPESLAFNGRFVSQVRQLTDKDRPAVLHLLDNASAPWAMRFFLQTTSNEIAYWGYDTSVGNMDIDLIRSHSFYGLAAENLFTLRLARAAAGRSKFDIPPHVLFDQKAAMALPFLRETRAAFDDSARAMLPYTSIAERDGFIDESGDFVEWEDFIGRPERQRRYFLKYGGPDVSRNWGSRAVYKLTSGARKTLDEVRAEVERGIIWLVQTAHSESSEVEFLDPRTGSAARENRVEKLSAFYGPYGYLGAKVMHRNHFKVHGQADTAMAVVEMEDVA